MADRPASTDSITFRDAAEVCEAITAAFVTGWKSEALRYLAWWTEHVSAPRDATISLPVLTTYRERHGAEALAALTRASDDPHLAAAEALNAAPAEPGDLADATALLDAIAKGRHQYDRMFGVVQIEMSCDVSDVKRRAKAGAKALRSLAPGTLATEARCVCGHLHGGQCSEPGCLCPHVPGRAPTKEE
jgi:hypothetical protein